MSKMITGLVYTMAALNAHFVNALPAYGGCTITSEPGAMGTEPGYIQGSSTMYQCVNDAYASGTSSFTYEIRSMGAYESVQAHSGFRIHNTGPLYINLQKCSETATLSKPIILVLASYEPTMWMIDTTDQDIIDNIDLYKVQVWTYYTETSNVTFGANLDGVVNPLIDVSRNDRGYGSDSGGGNTQGMLENIDSIFGDEVYSFVGNYEYETVYLCVGNEGDVNVQPTTTEAATAAATTEEAATTAASATTEESDPLECNPDLRSCSSSSSYCGYRRSVPSGSYVNGECNLVRGLCQCDIDGYNTNTCLPDVNGCNVCRTTSSSLTSTNYEANFPGYIARDSGGYEMLYCFNEDTEYDSFANEIRVIGVYEGSSDHSTAATINVNLKRCDNSVLLKPITLLLNSYESVNWVISSDDQDVIDNAQINEVIALAYEYGTTTISVSDDLTVINGQSVVNPYDSSSGWGGARGYGDDDGGGRTAQMLYNIPSVLGDQAYSMIGQYKTSTIQACVGDQSISVEEPATTKEITTIEEVTTTEALTTTESQSTPIETTTSSTAAVTAVSATGGDTVDPLECNSDLRSCSSSSSYCGSLRAVPSGSYTSGNCDLSLGRCQCEGINGYNKYTCLPDVNGCNICRTTTSSLTSTNYESNFPGYIARDSGGYEMLYCFNEDTEYDSFSTEIRVIGVYEGSSDHTTSATINVNLKTCDDSVLSKPITLLLSSYEAVDWVISSDDQDVIDNAQINKVEAIAYKYGTTTVSVSDELTLLGTTSVLEPYGSAYGTWGGYGSDSGGGSTAKMLYNLPSALGDQAYSFIGQYKTSNIVVCVGDQSISTDSDSDTTTDEPSDGTTEPDDPYVIINSALRINVVMTIVVMILMCVFV